MKLLTDAIRRDVYFRTKDGKCAAGAGVMFCKHFKESKNCLVLCAHKTTSGKCKCLEVPE